MSQALINRWNAWITRGREGRLRLRDYHSCRLHVMYLGFTWEQFA